jgi:hypothetical protein
MLLLSPPPSRLAAPSQYYRRNGRFVIAAELKMIAGPVIRITPNMLMCSDPKMLPVIYHRRADKADHYVTGSFGKTPGVFNIQPHEAHAVARKKIAQPVSIVPLRPTPSPPGRF